MDRRKMLKALAVAVASPAIIPEIAKALPVVPQASGPLESYSFIVLDVSDKLARVFLPGFHLYDVFMDSNGRQFYIDKDLPDGTLHAKCISDNITELIIVTERNTSTERLAVQKLFSAIPETPLNKEYAGEYITD